MPLLILNEVKFMTELDWDYWTAKQYIYTWQAAALVLGVNPRQIKFPRRNSAGELNFDQENFEGLFSDFKVKLDLLIEHAWMQNFSAQNMRVDLKRFLFWAHNVVKWDMPQKLLSFAKEINLQDLDENAEERASLLLDERASLQLIWALRLMLKDHQFGKTDRELIYYLAKQYPDQHGFKRLALEMKFAEAQIAS
jgi:hypothetical protein